MKRSCKNISITDWETVYPWVLECLMRHKTRYDFKTLICDVGGQDRQALENALKTYSNKPILDAAVLIAKEAVRQIETRNLKMRNVTYRERVDPSSGKVRLIGNEGAMQQVFDYIAVRSCNEIWARRFVPQQIAGLPNRGAIYGTRILQGWINRDNRAEKWAQKHEVRYSRKCKYHVKLDVKQCYPSMRADTFMKLFKRDCANKDILWLWEQLLKTHVTDDYKGFMIGALSSQYACQYVLQNLYRYTKELHYERRGKKHKCVQHMILQMDDLLLIGSNRKQLKSAVKKLIDYARDTFNLTIKDNWHINTLNSTPIDIVGYRLYANGGISIRARVFLRMRRLAMRVRRRARMSIEQARRACAFKGFFIDDGGRRITRHGKHADTRRATKKLRLCQLFKVSRTLISLYDRRLNNGNSYLLYGRA